MMWCTDRDGMNLTHTIFFISFFALALLRCYVKYSLPFLLLFLSFSFFGNIISYHIISCFSKTMPCFGKGVGPNQTIGWLRAVGEKVQ